MEQRIKYVSKKRCKTTLARLHSTTHNIALELKEITGKQLVQIYAEAIENLRRKIHEEYRIKSNGQLIIVPDGVLVFHDMYNSAPHEKHPLSECAAVFEMYKNYKVLDARLIAEHYMESKHV